MDMTRTEKVQLLKAWVYPLWILPRVCYPSKQIVRQMCTMVQMALGFDSWGSTLSEFGHSGGKRGFNLILPKDFCSSILHLCLDISWGNHTTSPHDVWRHLSDGRTRWGCV